MELLDLTCRLLTGQEVKLTVPGDTTISDIKDLISDECHLPPNNQKLIFKGQMLMNDKSIGSYNILSGSTVHVVESSPSSTTSGAQQQYPQRQPGNQIDFGESIASMGKLMSQFLKPGNASDGGSNRDWGETAENIKPFLMQGMKLAQEMTKGDSDFGKLASSLLSNMVGASGRQTGMERPSYPGAHASTEYGSNKRDERLNQGSSASSQGVDASDSKETKKEKSLHAAITSAKNSIHRTCNYVFGTAGSDSKLKDGDTEKIRVEDPVLSQLETALSLVYKTNGIFLENGTALVSKLPWELLEKLETVVADMNGEYAPRRDRSNVGDFMSFYAEVSNKSSELVKRLARWSEGTYAIKAERMASMSAICALQAALQSELALIMAVLSDRALQLEGRGEGNKTKTAQNEEVANGTYDTSSPVKCDEKFVEGNGPDSMSKGNSYRGILGADRASDITYGVSPYGISNPKGNEGTPNMMNMLSTFGNVAQRVLQPQKEARAHTAQLSSTNDDILAEDTEVRKLFNRYRNCTGFKSRMDELVQKTKSFGLAYCTGNEQK